MRLRFAPSPTGYLHVGNARTALFNWLSARGAGGAFVLRIEDTDASRSTRESEASILDDLRWLGLTWDEGPDVGGPYGPYRQSERGSLYRSHADRLLDLGLAYHCFCTHDELEAERRAALDAGAPVRYSGRCRHLASDEVRRRLDTGTPAAIRFRVPVRDVVFEDVVRGTVRFGADAIGDPAILRADGSPAYNFAVVVDDALMEITHVIRGEDHISNTPRQLLLHEALGFAPPRFAHLALVMGPDHSPLSKRHGATSVAEFRERGYLPEALVNYLALLGWSPRGKAPGAAADADETELVAPSELVRRFSLQAVGHSAGVFDEAKLAWVNRHYLKTADADRLAQLCVPFLHRAGVDVRPDAEGLRYLSSVVSIATSAVERLDQVPGRLAFLFDFDPAALLTQPEIIEELSGPGRVVVRAWDERLQKEPRLDRERFRAAAAEVRAETGQKGRALFHPIRLALTARTDGPELDLIVPAIDRGADLPASAGLPPVLGCRERVSRFRAIMDAR